MGYRLLKTTIYRAQTFIVAIEEQRCFVLSSYAIGDDC